MTTNNNVPFGVAVLDNETSDCPHTCTHARIHIYTYIIFAYANALHQHTCICTCTCSCIRATPGHPCALYDLAVVLLDAPTRGSLASLNVSRACARPSIFIFISCKFTYVDITHLHTYTRAVHACPGATRITPGLVTRTNLWTNMTHLV